MQGISPFEYNTIVTGQQFIGRDKEVAKLKQLLKNHKHALLYGPPKIGKRSVVYNAIQSIDSENVRICTINLFNIRYLEDLLTRIANLTLDIFSDGNSKLREEIKQSYLKGISLEYEHSKSFTDREIKRLLDFPESISKDKKTHLIVYFQQFQDILLFEKPNKILSLLEQTLANAQSTTYIIVGDKRNAMDYIFTTKNYFRNVVVNIPLGLINKKIFSEFICRKFEENSKQATLKEAYHIYDSMEGDPWYIQHLAEICFLHTKDTLTTDIVNQSIEKLLTIHDYELHNTAYSLSNHQLQLIRAILDGERKFSKSDNMEKYKLHSSANVNRLREALTKKEIVTFLNKSKIEFNDSLLKYWFKKHFFRSE